MQDLNGAKGPTSLPATCPWCGTVGISEKRDPAAGTTDVIVAAVEEWLNGVSDLHRQMAVALDGLSCAAAPASATERLVEPLVILLRRYRAQSPTRGAIEAWARSIAEPAARAVKPAT